MTFVQVEVDGLFELNGNTWRKRSTRTAELWPVRPGAGPLGATWCYFRNSERVVKLDKPRLTATPA